MIKATMNSATLLIQPAVLNKQYLNNNTVGVTKHSVPQNGVQLYILNILILVLTITAAIIKVHYSYAGTTLIQRPYCSQFRFVAASCIDSPLPVVYSG
jgi:hypothetical protein